MPSARFTFGQFLLDAGRGLLFEHGQPVIIGGKAVALLRTLLEAGGQVVPKSTLMDVAWPNLSVEESNLSVQIAALRKRLGVSPGQRDWIATFPRIGYRFAGDFTLEEHETSIIGPRERSPGPPGRRGVEPLALPDKPSIAILPFTNLGNGSGQDFFTDGLAEDIITELSRNSALFVIARHSTFAYKGRSVDVRQIARDLGVRYLLEGSVRRASSRVRVNAQLIDALTGAHVWAERYDRNLDDIFAVQDEVTGKITESLLGRLTIASERNRPSNLEAYDLCVRGRSLAGLSPEAGREARILISRAIQLDAHYAEAYRWLAWHLWAAWAQWGEPEHPNRLEAVSAARKAVELDSKDAGGHLVLGKVLMYERRWPESEAAYFDAVAISPNYADAWAMLADFTVLSGNPGLAIEQAEKALRLNPRAPGWYYWNLGFTQYAAHQYEAAVSTLRHELTYATVSRRILAASLAQLGRLKEAREEAELFMSANPLFTIDHWNEVQPFHDSAMREHFNEGYREAGLPE